MVRIVWASRILPVWYSKLLVAFVVSLFSCSLYAAGFQIQEQNVTNLGTAYTGTAAMAADASTSFYNPAGLIKIANKQIVLSGVAIHASSNLTASSSNVSYLPSTPATGDPYDDAGGLHAVPSIHFGARLNDDWVFGFSVVSPFGLKTDYDHDSIARYVATSSEIRTLDFSPSLAWAANDFISLAAGFDIVFVEAQLNAQIGDGSVIGGDVESDGHQNNHAEAWSQGWHAGILINLFENFRIGGTYRSLLKVKAEGESEQLSVNNPILAGWIPVGAYTTRIVRVNLTLPESITGSFNWDVFEDLALVGECQWTKWSRIRTLRLRFDPVVGTVDTDTHLQLRNTFRYGLGLIYKLNETFTFRVGGAFDQAPIVTERRTARVPDSDRLWLALGGGVKLTKNLHFDLGYAHLFFSDADIIDEGPTFANRLTNVSFAKLEGEYDSYANIFGIQMRYDFV